MKTEDLRKGNYIYSFNIKTTVTLKTLEAIESEYMGGSPYEPIILTEDWLFNFGFKCIDTNEDGGDHFYVLSETEFLLDRSYQYDSYYKRVDIKFVHQLQNLYFALVGKELEFKPETNE